MITQNEEREIEKAVREAGNILANARIEAENIHEKKGPANFVTDYDVKIQRYLMEKFSDIIPSAAYFGEEDTEGNGRTFGKGYTFFIDPIDGTTNFMFDYHNSCISVGLGLGGSMIAGWVFDPYKDQFYKAFKGRGAFLNDRRLSISDRALNEGIFAFGCARYNEGDKIFKALEKIFMQSLSIRNGGSAAIDLCRIASGSNVAYAEMKLQPYDYAAAGVIITEAGGVIGQADGKEITLDLPCSVVAGTRKAAEEIKRILNDL
ncbi:MAG: inositol monophosphatase [Lachnospiraceae bacterium]|nr:inositol monophosphatase [Lachnospiraceae bacterium]